MTSRCIYSIQSSSCSFLCWGQRSHHKLIRERPGVKATIFPYCMLERTHVLLRDSGMGGTLSPLTHITLYKEERFLMQSSDTHKLLTAESSTNLFAFKVDIPFNGITKLN